MIKISTNKLFNDVFVTLTRPNILIVLLNYISDMKQSLERGYLVFYYSIIIAVFYLILNLAIVANYNQA